MLQDFSQCGILGNSTKIRLYNSSVKSVLLYGSECWQVVKRDMDEINAFHNGCLRKICRILRPDKVSIEELYHRAGCNSVIHDIKRPRLRWLGHTHGTGQDKITKVADDGHHLENKSLDGQRTPGTEQFKVS